MSNKCCVLQDDLKDCGVCSLLSIIKYNGGNVPKEYLRELTKTNKTGVSALNIIRAARELGFEAYGLKGKLKDIKNDYLPIIAHVTIDKKYNHFVVIYKIDFQKNKILIMDPKKGFVYLSFSNFANISTNYFLFLKKKQLIPKLNQKNSFYDNLKKVILNYKIVLLVIAFISLLYVFINILNSYHFKLFFDEVFETSKGDLFKLLILFIVLIIFRCLLHLFRSFLVNQLNIIIDKEIVNHAFNHIINLPYLYYRNHTNGDLFTRINDLSNIKELISNFFVNIFVDMILAFIVIIIMFNINWVLSIVIIIMLIIYGIITIISNKNMVSNIRENYNQLSGINNYLVESLTSFETIKNLSLQKYISNNFNNKYQEYNNHKRKLFNKISVSTFFKNIILFTGEVILLFIGITYLKNNQLSISLLITFITLSNYFIEPIKNTLELSLVYQTSKESIRRIKEIYNIPKEEELVNKKMSLNQIEGRISINNVSYSYDGVKNILNNVSLEIDSGEKVLVYGNSGCGKSTLMQLIIKYLDNTYNGSIDVDGYDLKKIDLSSIRKNICYVSQNEYLYTDSVFNNITLGRKISYKNFLNIGKNLFIDKIVEKSNLGYNYMIENNGENISGGERMRIIIARTIISKYNVYIYDETFSSLDISMERDILKYLFELYKNKTIIIISHRKSNLDLFNKVVKIDE